MVAVEGFAVEAERLRCIDSRAACLLLDGDGEGRGAGEGTPHEIRVKVGRYSRGALAPGTQ